MIGLDTSMFALPGGGVLGALWAGWGLAKQGLAYHRQAVAVVDEALSGEPSRSLWQAMVAHFPAEARASAPGLGRRADQRL